MTGVEEEKMKEAMKEEMRDVPAAWVHAGEKAHAVNAGAASVVRRDGIFSSTRRGSIAAG